MPYNTKPILTDVNGKPIPQYFNPTADAYEPLYGRNGATRVELYDASGNPITVTSGKLAVRATELEALLDGLEAALGAPSDAEATGDGSLVALLKRLRTLMGNAAKHMHETQSGSLVTTVPAGATIVVTQVAQACDLESLSMGTDYNFMALRVENRRADGTYEQGMRLVGPSGQWTNPIRPRDLHDLNGENDFWREFVYDDTNKKYALGMKRQSKFGAGIRIRLYNQDTVEHNAAVTWMISVFRN